MAILIGAQPGISISELARRMGKPKTTVWGRLPGLEEAGILLAEDDNGGLYLFERQHADYTRQPGVQS
ncbi:MAG: winged helix-turn-helix domain-containing protein [Vampirovibrionales bacterium]|nr:winged helix-turn-helix domain-containing protein [Vampirovibrionales bacterium]